MMFPSFLSSAGIAVLAAAGTSGPTHAWIADIKAQRTALMGQEVRLEGEVMDVRSTSPSARRGYYRLSDASDPVGVLVRSEAVPIEGGSFRLRAKVADDQIVNGTLLLDELERDQTNARPMLPVIAAFGSGLALALAVVLFRRAWTEERRYAVAPPLWLMPDAGPYGKALAVGGSVQPPLKYDAELEEADRLQRDRLKRRKRSLLQATVGSLALTGLSAVWVLGTKAVAGQVPAFIFIDSDPSVAAAPVSVDTARVEQSASIRGDTAIRVVNPVGPDTARDRRNATALAVSPGRIRSPEAVQTPRGRDSAAAMADTVQHDVAVADPAPSPVPVAPPPAPPPPPPPPPPAPEPVATPRDPEVDRTRAHAQLEESAGKLVAAINGKRIPDIALLMPESMAGDLGRRERFLKLVRDLSPKASLGGVEEAIVTDDRGQARITVSFTWRGDFGVDKKKTARLLAMVRRDGEVWRFEGARLLDAVP